MSAKILRRCTICKNFHASYLVEDPQLGKCYLCLRCWKARSLSSEKHPTPVANENTRINSALLQTDIEELQSYQKIEKR